MFLFAFPHHKIIPKVLRQTKPKTQVLIYLALLKKISAQHKNIPLNINKLSTYSKSEKQNSGFADKRILVYSAKFVFQTRATLLGNLCGHCK